MSKRGKALVTCDRAVQEQWDGRAPGEWLRSGAGQAPAWPPDFRPDTVMDAADLELGVGADGTNLDKSSGLALLQVLHPVQRQQSPNTCKCESGFSREA